MAISISSQAYIFLCSIFGGMLIAFIYDVFRIQRKAVKTNSIILHIEDLFYWIIVALVMFAVTYYSNDGELRGFIVIGTIIGVVLYIVFLSKLVIGISMLLLRTLYQTLRFIYKIISYPIIIILKVLAVPTRFILKLLGKGYRKAKRAGRNRLKRLSIWRRVFKNIRKKI